MSSPVLKQDIVAAAVTWLLSKTDVTSAVSMFNIDGRVVPGLFQYRIWLPNGIEGTSGTACVITHEGGWAAPNMHNTMRFPRLLLSIWADPIRDSALNISDPGEAQRRVSAVYETIDRHLHHVGGNGMWWGELRVITSVRLTEPVITVMPDGDGMIRLQVFYAITQA